MDLLAIDLGKRSFHIYGVDGDGVIISRKVGRSRLSQVIDNLAPAVIAMEACASAQLGADLRCCRPGHTAHQPTFREALRQRIKE